MRTKIKFHTIAIVSIILIIIAAYFVIQNRRAANAPIIPAYTGNTVEIISATWGMGCNPAINRAIAAAQRTPLTTADAKALPRLVLKDNVLPAISIACNGKPSCTVNANSDSLGLDPLATCFKRLTVSYRCYNYDRLSVRDVGQGETVMIDCTKPGATNDPAPIPTK